MPRSLSRSPSYHRRRYSPPSPVSRHSRRSRRDRSRSRSRSRSPYSNSHSRSLLFIQTLLPMLLLMFMLKGLFVNFPLFFFFHLTVCLIVPCFTLAVFEVLRFWMLFITVNGFSFFCFNLLSTCLLFFSI